LGKPRSRGIPRENRISSLIKKKTQKPKITRVPEKKQEECGLILCQQTNEGDLNQESKKKKRREQGRGKIDLLLLPQVAPKRSLVERKGGGEENHKKRPRSQGGKEKEKNVQTGTMHAQEGKVERLASFDENSCMTVGEKKKHPTADKNPDGETSQPALKGRLLQDNAFSPRNLERTSTKINQERPGPPPTRLTKTPYTRSRRENKRQKTPPAATDPKSATRRRPTAESITLQSLGRVNTKGKRKKM